MHRTQPGPALLLPGAGRPAKTGNLPMAAAVDRAAAAVERVLGLLPEQDRMKAMDKLVERLKSLYADSTADRRAA